MKKFLLTLLLLVGTPVFANNIGSQENLFCVQLSVKYTAFALAANSFKTEKEYKEYWYSLIVKSNDDEYFRKTLMQLVNIAWKYKDSNITADALKIYVACSDNSGTQT